jgi:hypothetical protein
MVYAGRLNWRGAAHDYAMGEATVEWSGTRIASAAVGKKERIGMGRCEQA